MNTTDNTTPPPRRTAVASLEKSPLNARRSGARTGRDDLKPPVLAHGLPGQESGGGRTTYLVTAWCERPFYARCEVEAGSPQEALGRAREAIHDAHARECDDDYYWDEWLVDSPEADGVLFHLAPPARLRGAAPQLLEACRMVVDRWARGDLAGAARACQAAIGEATEQEGRPDADLPAEAALPGLVTLLWDFIENGTSSYGLNFFDLRAKVREEAAAWEDQGRDLPAARDMLLEALQAVLPYAENEAASLQECWKRDGDAAVKEEADACGRVLARARAALARTTAEGRPA